MTPAAPPPTAARPGGLAAFLERGSDLPLVATLLAIGFALRAAVVLLAIRTGRHELMWDEVFVARRMAAGLGYSFDYYGRLPAGDGPSAFFPPGYVYNIYWLLKAFGTVLVVAWENAVLSTLVGLALFAFAKRWFDRPTARLALLLATFYPPFVTRVPHGAVVFPKMLLGVLLGMALLKVWERRGAGVAFAGGLTAGLLALMMPDVVLLVLLFAGCLLLAPPRGRASLRAAGALALGTALVMAPWTIRNAQVFDRFCLVSTNGGFNFYMGNYPGSPNEVVIDAILDLDRRLGGELARADEFGRERIFYREGLRWMREHPGDAARALLQRVGLHWSFRPANFKDMGVVPGVSATPDWIYFSYNWSYAVAYLLVLACALPGLWLERRRWFAFAPLFMVFAYSTAVAALFVVQSKMRLMKVDPFLLVFAAAALARWASGGRAGAGATREAS